MRLLATPAVSDEMLMEAISSQQPRALADLYDRYGGVLKALVFRVVRNEAEANDLLQESFLHVWKQAGNYSVKKGKPLGWLVTIARKRAIDRLRKRKAYNGKERLELSVAQNSSTWSYSTTEEDISQNDIRAFLKDKIDDLPPLHKQAMELVFFDGMTQREIAFATGKPLRIIRNRLELGLRKLCTESRGLKETIL